MINISVPWLASCETGLVSGKFYKLIVTQKFCSSKPNLELKYQSLVGLDREGDAVPWPLPVQGIVSRSAPSPVEIPGQQEWVMIQIGCYEEKKKVTWLLIKMFTSTGKSRYKEGKSRPLKTKFFCNSSLFLIQVPKVGVNTQIPVFCCHLLASWYSLHWQTNEPNISFKSILLCACLSVF